MSAESSENPHSYPSSEQFGVVDEDDDSHGELSDSTDDEEPETESAKPAASEVNLEPSSPAQLKGEF